eukprot:2901044-Prymnesium_polylepis.1
MLFAADPQSLTRGFALRFASRGRVANMQSNSTTIRKLAFPKSEQTNLRDFAECVVCDIPGGITLPTLLELFTDT